MIQEEVRLITEFASLAPSVHNTQPWRFVASEHALEVRADPSRRLEYLDGDTRQLHISCGAAVEFARLAIRALGYACVVRLAPAADDPTLLATITVGHPVPAKPTERRLVEAASRRYTDRGSYDDRPVPHDVIVRMTDAASEVGCYLRMLTRPGDRLTASLLLQKAEEIESADPGYREELGRWMRNEGAPDGIPVQATDGWPLDRVPDVPLRDFTDTSHYPTPDELDTPPSVERDMLVLLGSDADDRLGWLRTGRALAMILLILTDAGVASQPLGPATDVPATRAQLQRSLGLLGHPQMLLRIGYGHGQPRTGRRSVDDTLTVASVT
jgi:hypothetical protein